MKTRGAWRLSLVVFLSVGSLWASPGGGEGERVVRLNRFLHHGQTESVELACANGNGTCRLLRRRNGVVAAEIAMPRDHADTVLGSFFQLVPRRAQRRTAGERDALLYWDVRWLGRRVEGRLDRGERKFDEVFVDAVLSLEGALVAQFYGPGR